MKHAATAAFRRTTDMALGCRNSGRSKMTDTVEKGLVILGEQ